MENSKVVDILNDMLTRNYDAEKGYKEAAEKVENDSLKEWFLDQAENRYSFGHTVKDLIAKYGGEPDKGTSLAGDLHREWIAIRDTFSSGDEAIYKECIRGEEAFANDYAEILNTESLPEDIRTAVSEQKSSVEKALDALKNLKDFNA